MALITSECAPFSRVQLGCKHHRHWRNRCRIPECDGDPHSLYLSRISLSLCPSLLEPFRDRASVRHCLYLVCCHCFKAAFNGSGACPGDLAGRDFCYVARADGTYNLGDVVNTSRVIEVTARQSSLLVQNLSSSWHNGSSPLPHRARALPLLFGLLLITHSVFTTHHNTQRGTHTEPHKTTDYHAHSCGLAELPSSGPDFQCGTCPHLS